MNSVFEVREQNRLSLEKCFSLVLSGVQFRLFRSAVTVVVISLAVAFLVTMLTDGFIGQEVAKAVDVRSMPTKTYLFWVDRLSVPLGSPAISSTLTDSTAGDDRQKEFGMWGGLDGAQVAKLAETASQESTYLVFFSELPEGVKRPLVGRTSGTAIFDMLLDDKEFARFREMMPKTGKQMPTSIDEFASFLTRWQEAKAARAAIAAGHAKALAQVKEMTGGVPAAAVLCTGDAKFLQNVQALGFRLDEKQLEMIRVEAGLNSDIRKIEDLLKVNEFKSRFAAMYNKNPRDVTLDDFFSQASSPKEAQVFLDAAAKVAAEKKLEPLGITADRMVQVARYRQDQSELAALEAKLLTARSGKGFLGFSGRTLWLIAVSLMVCIVGIANAMLMSVTERFKEIATMKCLGATDGFIMINFILESAMQGFAGGVLGAIVGLLLGALRSGTTYGMISLGNLPVLTMVVTAVTAIVVGIVISILAAVYPAWVAARLAPMEAMRVE
jgi:hypothetical protein